MSGSQLPSIPGVLLRTVDNDVFFIPVTDLLGFRMHDAWQAGSIDGDRLQQALDQAPAIVGLKSALMIADGIELDTDAESPTFNKEKFAADALETIPEGEPQGGKEKFAPYVLGGVDPSDPQGGKEKMAEDTAASAPQGDKEKFTG